MYPSHRTVKAFTILDSERDWRPWDHGFRLYAIGLENIVYGGEEPLKKPSRPQIRQQTASQTSQGARDTPPGNHISPDSLVPTPADRASQTGPPDQPRDLLERQAAFPHLTQRELIVYECRLLKYERLNVHYGLQEEALRKLTDYVHATVAPWLREICFD